MKVRQVDSSIVETSSIEYPILEKKEIIRLLRRTALLWYDEETSVVCTSSEVRAYKKGGGIVFSRHISVIED